MTNKEAAEILDDYDVNFDGHTVEEIAEAFDVAFKALAEPKQGECTDCCNGNQIEKAKLCQKSYLAGMKHKQEPKTGHWIAVEDRLPEPHKWVLCSCRASIYEVLMLTDKGWEDGCDKAYMRSFVLAWQPLPQPYKADKENE